MITLSLLKNPNFDEGHHHQDNIPEIVVPDGWYLYWIDGETFPGSGGIAYRPESVVWNINDAPPHERPIFFLSGNYCWKVFKADSPLYFAVTQKVTGLEPGAKYRFTAKVYPDIVAGYHAGKKVRPGDIWAAEARAGWSDPDTPWPHAQDGDVHWTKWFNIHNRNFEFGKYNDIWVEFVAPSPEVRVWLECKAKWGLENNWFMDSFSLEMVAPAPGHPPVEPPPVEPEPPEEPAEPPVTPVKGRGAPRVQYERIYFLLPKTLPDEMLAAAVRVARDVGATVGFSPDDAGIGDLDERRVICVNPDQIKPQVNQAWYDQYYPGVRFTPITYAASAEDLEAQLRSIFLL